MTKIKTLKNWNEDHTKRVPIAPRTHVKAVFDDKGNTLDSLMAVQDEKLSELGSLMGSVMLEGKGKEGVFKKLNNVLPKHTYRIYVQRKWEVPSGLSEGQSWFEVYQSKGDGNFDFYVSVKSGKSLRDYYDVSIPSDYDTEKPLYIYIRANIGEKLTFVIEDITNSILNGEFRKLSSNFYIQGKGEDFNYIRYYGSVGRIYRITLNKLVWDAVKPSEDSSIFYLSTTDKNGVESTIASIASFGDLKNWYEVEFKEGTQCVNIGGRANIGDNIFVSIDDVTDRLASDTIAHISSYNDDMTIEGEYIPIMNTGYIPFQQSTADINNVTHSVDRRHKAIECKEGDIYMIQGVGGISGRLFFLVDKDGNTLSYSKENYDTTEQPFFFRCYTDGYLIINVSARHPYKVVKVNHSALKDKFDVLQYVRWVDGFMDVNTGGEATSSANQCTGYMPTFGYKRIRIKENVSTSSVATSGITFYDSKRQYIKGFVCTIGASKGVVERVYNIPDNAAYFRTTIWKEYLSEAVVELFNEKRDVDYIGFRNFCNFAKVEAEDSFEMADWTGQQVIDNIYEPLRAAYPQYITRKSLGKDATGAYDIWCYEFNNSVDEWFALDKKEQFHSSTNVIPPLRQGLTEKQFALGKSFFDNNKKPYDSLYVNSVFEVTKPTKVLDIVEKSINGNPFYVFTCVDAVESTLVDDKPCVTLWYVKKIETHDQHGVIISGTHADEISGYIGVGLALKYMIEHHFENESLNYIFNSVKLTVVPIVNVWGANQNPKARQNANGVSMSNYGSPQEYPSELVAIDGLMKSVRDDASFFIDFHTSEWWKGYGMTYAITDHKSPLYPAIIATSNYLCRHWFPSLPPFNWNIGQSSGTGTIYSTTRAKEKYDIPSSTIEFTGLDLISFSGCTKWDAQYMSFCVENYLNYLIALCELRLNSKPEKLIGNEFFYHQTMS